MSQFKQRTSHIVRIDWGNSRNPETRVPGLADYARLVAAIDSCIKAAYPASSELEEHYGRVTWNFDEPARPEDAGTNWRLRHLRHQISQEARLHDHPGVLTWVENTEFEL